MENFSQRILDNLTSAVLLLDRDLRLTYVNPAAEMLFALSARQATGLRIAELLSKDAEFVQGLRDAVDSGHPHTVRERALKLPGGRQVTVDCTVNPVIEPGLPPALLVEMIHVDRHLRIAREEQLIAQHQATRALIRGLAHEIKNPLGGLRGAAQLLERELPNETLREYTEVIIAEADRLRNLLNRMLGPNTLPRREPVNLHHLMERVRKVVEAEKSTGVTVIRDYDPSIPDLNADPDQLIQALLNIVRNALQAVGEKGKITLRSRVQRRFTIGHRLYRLVARVDVIDNGPGVPAELRENLFYPMVTGRPDGTGLGLTIAQSLVNQHDGLIECESRPGRTCFTFLLPFDEPESERTDG
ncbi:nitrogen regulation protein NR(II) [Endothiovibrio diazotrophicus]